MTFKEGGVGVRIGWIKVGPKGTPHDCLHRCLHHIRQPMRAHTYYTNQYGPYRWIEIKENTL